MKEPVKNKKVFVGMSGGVDSSVSAAILKEKGFDVTGVFIKAWHPDFLPCSWKEDRRDAMRVCAKLNIPFLTFDLEKEYKKEVVDYLIDEYKNGRTPNPDVMCNKNIKFGHFFDKAMEMGADFVATGHYARNAKLPGTKEKFVLMEGKDKNKDQSYFLWTLNQDQLSKILFPVGDIEKPAVRKIAKKYDLNTAEKKDSQGICFLGKVDIKDFLKKYLNFEKGDVLNEKGEKIGFHDGSIFYTIGQRHGFTITKKGDSDEPLYIVSKDVNKNVITVSNKKHVESDLGVKMVLLKDTNWVSGLDPEDDRIIEARVRYRQERQKCSIKKKGDNYKVSFQKPQSGVSLGQSVVFYENDICLGGGIIKETYQN